jgi:hypothetical protein
MLNGSHWGVWAAWEKLWFFHAAQNIRYSREFLRNLFQNVQEHFSSFGIFLLPDNFGHVMWVEFFLFLLEITPICSTMVGLNKCISYPKFQANPYTKKLYLVEKNSFLLKITPICSTMVGLNKCIIYPKFEANPYTKNLYPQFITFPKAMRRLSHDGG